ncbi:hypothetical protein AMTRI_Chr05g67540 [Amborella trichopoda]
MHDQFHDPGRWIVELEDLKAWMHDQLRDLGRRIVELEDLDDPRRRSRLWSEEDVPTTMKNHTGRGLMLKNESERSWELEAFKPMTNLKRLSISGVSLNGNFKSISPKLVRLKLQGYPLPYLPGDLSYEELVVLELSNKYCILRNFKHHQATVRLGSGPD